MAKMMKAAVVRELGKPLALEEVPVPEPKENQILVRIAATGSRSFALWDAIC
jgi:alcohol dehydrogenase, propanol-preferring